MQEEYCTDREEEIRVGRAAGEKRVGFVSRVVSSTCRCLGSSDSQILREAAAIFALRSWVVVLSTGIPELQIWVACASPFSIANRSIIVVDQASSLIPPLLSHQRRGHWSARDAKAASNVCALSCAASSAQLTCQAVTNTPNQPEPMS